VAAASRSRPENETGDRVRRSPVVKVVELFLFFLLLVLLGIALFAGLAVLLGVNAALMSAIFALGFGFIAAGFVVSERRSRHQRTGKQGNDREFDQFHGY
jgi:UPF0716 family protein affecting phage T7 exclusion